MRDSEQVCCGMRPALAVGDQADEGAIPADRAFGRRLAFCAFTLSLWPPEAPDPVAVGLSVIGRYCRIKTCNPLWVRERPGCLILHFSRRRERRTRSVQPSRLTLAWPPSALSVSALICFCPA